MSALLNLRVLAVLAIVAVMTAGYMHYTGLKADLQAAVEDAASARANAELAISAAEANAYQLAQEKKAHRRTIAILEDLQEELGDLEEEARREDAKILSSPPEANGPVPPVLGDFLLRRFGE